MDPIQKTFSGASRHDPLLDKLTRNPSCWQTLLYMQTIQSSPKFFIFSCFQLIMQGEAFRLSSSSKCIDLLPECRIWLWVSLPLLPSYLVDVYIDLSSFFLNYFTAFGGCLIPLCRRGKSLNGSHPLSWKLFRRGKKVDITRVWHYVYIQK